ncbi:glutathione S-transferase 1-like [Pectinophora gossypiella]|uniref:glutathione S-transferase 1-like n=1 Tax=Pectinophora gossypiella TaxID=13191 RepID=UPI00214E96C7|nr:glutathione S-transferase 1-like [Pectinophora gossypiella]XP_049885732.1 glutathione S-transferase 1-like [Pectinophora gossypiella]
MVLTLYKLDPSSSVRAVLMTIEALNIQDIEYIDVNLLTGEHLKDEYVQLNPQHTIPTLKDDDFVIWDSHAISSYLVNKYASDESLYPGEIKMRAIIDQRLHFDSGILFPALRGAVEPVIYRGEKLFRPENLDKIKSAYGFTNKFLTTPWLAGDQLTIADICCIATVSSMNEIFPVAEDIYPNLAAWMARCSEQHFYKKGNLPGLNIFRELLKSKLS